MPMAGLAIGLEQTTSQRTPEVRGRVAAIALAAAAFETHGPPIAAFALRYRGEEGRVGFTQGERPSGAASPRVTQ